MRRVESSSRLGEGLDMSRVGLAAITLAAMAAAWTVGGARASTNFALGKTVSIVATDPDPHARLQQRNRRQSPEHYDGQLLPDATAYGSAAAIAQAIEWNGAGHVSRLSAHTRSGLIVDVDDNDVIQLSPTTGPQARDVLYTPIVSVGFGFAIFGRVCPTRARRPAFSRDADGGEDLRRRKRRQFLL